MGPDIEARAIWYMGVSLGCVVCVEAGPVNRPCLGYWAVFGENGGLVYCSEIAGLGNS